MEDQGELSPYEARDAVVFIELMQQLKERSGQTFRELEERAARNGDVLARSTLADILRRKSLPRPEVLAAFVRACGDGQRVGLWLDARDRIAALPAAASDTETTAGPKGAADPAVQPQLQRTTGLRPRRARVRAVALTTALMVLLLALAVWRTLLIDSDDAGAPAVSATTSRAPADGWVTIRPARTPDLCLTDGRDRRGAYASAVAVQLPCAQAPTSNRSARTCTASSGTIPKRGKDASRS
ncbi:hypothetical protein OG604_14915 [Streptomyces sp. NBC_01231]|nr:hypothetical protein OG604_14915 [Streptomyces sp. NBC_01231]